MWILQKKTPAVNWPGLAYSAQQLLKTRGALAPVPPPFPTPMQVMVGLMEKMFLFVSTVVYILHLGLRVRNVGYISPVSISAVQVKF